MIYTIISIWNKFPAEIEEQMNRYASQGWRFSGISKSYIVMEKAENPQKQLNG